MKAKIQNIQIDLSNPIDISMPLSNTNENPIAWYIEKPAIEPVKFGDWIGKVSEGSSTNFNNIFFNDRGNTYELNYIIGGLQPLTEGNRLEPKKYSSSPISKPKR
jgi:hypothetical protein